MSSQQSFEYYNIWSEHLKSYLREKGDYVYFQLFMNQFEKRYDKTIKKYNLDDLCQLSGGNRLRPTIILSTYLYNKPLMLQSIKINDISKLIDVCVGVELIHKASLILDDMIDGDETRKGIPTFHVKYGDKYTGMFSATLISDALNILNNTFSKLNAYHKNMTLSTNLIYNMALGGLRELQLNSADIFQMSKIKKIVDGEVSSLFTSSLLLGYYCGSGEEKNITNLLIELGDTCGFFFQLLNDLEPYLTEDKNAAHKSTTNYDIYNNKANLIIAYLGEFLSKKEKNEYMLLKNGNEKIQYIIEKLDKYDIIDFSLTQKELIKDKFQRIFRDFSKYGATDSWVDLISQSLNMFIIAGEKRLH